MLKRVRDWTPNATPVPAPRARQVVRLATQSSALSDDTPSVPIRQSDIREVQRITYEEDQDNIETRVAEARIHYEEDEDGEETLVFGKRPKRPASDAPEREDEALGALVQVYVARASAPRASALEEDETGEPPPPRSERRPLRQRTAPETTAASEPTLERIARWLGELDRTQRVVLVSGSAVVASLITLLAAR